MRILRRPLKRQFLPLRSVALLALLPLATSAQTFDVASIKPSAKQVGKDYRGSVIFEPNRISARNVSLKSLLVEAYYLQPFQITGGPGWLDLDEFDLDARAGGPSSVNVLRNMLQSLLVDRFDLAVHHDNKDMRVYTLVVDKSGSKITPVDRAPIPNSGPAHFRGDMRQFANLLAVRLTIPTATDPTQPVIASGPPVPVVDKTGLAGVYEFNLDVPPELGVDSFTRSQRALREQLGLKLETERSSVPILVIDHADRIPISN